VEHEGAQVDVAALDAVLDDDWGPGEGHCGLGDVVAGVVHDAAGELLANGSLGIFVYDELPGGSLIPRLATSTDGGSTWSTIALAPPFDPTLIQGGSSTDHQSAPTRTSSRPVAASPWRSRFGSGSSEDVWWYGVETSTS